MSVALRWLIITKEVCIYSDYKLDESYTPARISIKAGTTYHDLQEIKAVDIEEPTGWVSVPLVGANNMYVCVGSKACC